VKDSRSGVRTVLSLSNGLPERASDKGAVLLAEGEDDKLLYLLIEGEVEVLKGDIVNTQSEPGAIFGELAIWLESPHTATVRAVTPCRAYVIEDPGAFLQAHPDFALLLASLLARKLKSITTYLVDLKNQFQDPQDHLGMVDEVLETLMHQPVEELVPGSDRYPDRTL